MLLRLQGTGTQSMFSSTPQMAFRAGVSRQFKETGVQNELKEQQAYAPVYIIVIKCNPDVRNSLERKLNSPTRSKSQMLETVWQSS